MFIFPAGGFGTWGGRSPSADLAQQAMLGRNQAGWSAGLQGEVVFSAGGVEHVWCANS